MDVDTRQKCVPSCTSGIFPRQPVEGVVFGVSRGAGTVYIVNTFSRLFGAPIVPRHHPPEQPESFGVSVVATPFCTRRVCVSCTPFRRVPTTSVPLPASQGCSPRGHPWRVNTQRCPTGVRMPSVPFRTQNRVVAWSGGIVTTFRHIVNLWDVSSFLGIKSNRTDKPPLPVLVIKLNKSNGLEGKFRQHPAHTSHS